jgi:hypothetical protein
MLHLTPTRHCGWQATNQAGARNPLFFDGLGLLKNPLKQFPSRTMHENQSSRSPDRSRGRRFCMAGSLEPIIGRLPRVLPAEQQPGNSQATQAWLLDSSPTVDPTITGAPHVSNHVFKCGDNSLPFPTNQGLGVQWQGVVWDEAMA